MDSVREAVWGLLPENHRTFALKFSVATGFHGFFRLYGLGTSEDADLFLWNQPQTWTQYWPSDLSDFLFFGGTGLGDQYAYKKSLLKRSDETVFMLDAVDMVAEKVGETFEDFYSFEFLENCKAPYIQGVSEVFATFGAINPCDTVVYTPPLQLGGGDPNNIRNFRSSQAMILNGDVKRQVSSLSESSLVSKIDVFHDREGKLRLNLVCS